MCNYHFFIPHAGCMTTLVFHHWSHPAYVILTFSKDNFFGNARVWTQGLAFARQALYHLSHDPNHFLLSVIFYIGSYTFYSELVSDHDPHTYASHIAWIIEMTHHALLVCWDGVSLTFCLSWPRTMIFPISTSQVAGITGMYHHTCAQKLNYFEPKCCIFAFFLINVLLFMFFGLVLFFLHLTLVA
jgi:hypothetical protein